MAKTIAHARGLDASRTKRAHCLGSRAAEAEAATWRTFATVHMRADGGGRLELTRDGSIIHSFEWGPE